MPELPPPRCFATVITWSHLPYVRALRDSLQATGNREPFHVLIPDAPAGLPPRSEDGLVFVTLAELVPTPPARMVYYFNAFELCNTLKPFLVAHLLGTGCERVIYLDCDLFVTGSFAPVWQQLDQAPLLLTPHQLAPPPLDLPYITEIDIVDMGLFNGGFSAWRRGPEADRMLAWMHSRFPVYGFADRAHGMFVDQKLLPLLAEYYPAAVKILRDPRLNIAFWNVHERAVQPDGPGRWSVAGQPVIFFHLSGYRTSRPGIPCVYMPDSSNHALLERSPWFKDVLTAYHQGLARHESGHPAVPYPFARFAGTRLTADFRRLLFRTGRLDRGSLDYWIIWLRELLRPPKWFLTRLVNSVLNRVRSR
ncbi:hypothetical protein Verru16b_02830 [Lacunisphaera limnophila]|uniref:Glycosyl transferase family 8 n=1 Tax=Lacunisphaera limnophila TaxID=1838286 RepID=A0A1D8AXX5_9BACT|nr:hypothetical protein [Lacunisphaera limnophila]AOS45743.1 hypothetical protein Verru16b_02830 [Lacunisphaera limnophila]